MNENRIIDELVERGLFEPPMRLEAIDGGTINNSFVLHQGTTRYHLKTFEMNRLAPIDRQAIYDLQCQVAELGRAPKLYYLSANHDFQVEEWVEHTSLANAELADAEKLNVLARRLCDIHSLPNTAISLDLPDDWKMYMEQAGLSTDSTMQERLTACEKIWQVSHLHDQVLCHNDLNMEHVALRDSKVIFDWEYAACNNRYFDLAACIAVNELSETQAEMLCQYYASLAELDFEHVKAQVAEQAMLVELTNELWFKAAATIPYQ